MKVRERGKIPPPATCGPGRRSAGIGGAVVLFAALAMALPGAANGAELNANQIMKLMSGTKVKTETQNDGSPVYLAFKADGSMTARIERAGQNLYDDGKWWTARNRLLCWQFERFFSAKRFCATVAVNGNEIVRHWGRSGSLVGVAWVIDEAGPEAGAIMQTASATAAPRPARPPSRPVATTPDRAPLNSERIKMVMSGATVKTKTTRGGYPIFLEFKADGSLSGRIERPDKAILDNGKWWTAKNRLLCWQFGQIGGAKRKCVTIELNGNEIVRHRGRDGSLVESKWFIDKGGPGAGGSVEAASAAPAPRPSRPRPRPVPTVQDREPPSIEAPESVSAIGAVAEFVGRVSDASQIVEVAVNGRPVAFEADGTVRIRRGVPQGRSTIIIAALDEWGNRASRRITVTREALVATAPMIPPEKIPPRTESFSDIHFGNYHALVIGNNNYRELSQLKTAEDDAKAVARVLRDDYGFKVEVLLNATRGDMIGALTKLRAKLTTNDNLLIYYAGHGELDTVAEQGYWLPVDAEADVPTNWVSNSDITVMVRAIRAKHIMVVADSCYSGTLVRASQTNIKTANARRAWLERMSKKRARTALVSGGLEPVLDGGGGGHSVFAKAFLDALNENEGVLDGQALFDAIKRPIVVNADQTPQYSDIRRAGHDGGDFMFVRR